MEGGGTAYGAGKAGGPFDPLAYIKKPQVILRAVSWVSDVFRRSCTVFIGFKGHIICVISACDKRLSVAVTTRTRRSSARPNR